MFLRESVCGSTRVYMHVDATTPTHVAHLLQESVMTVSRAELGSVLSCFLPSVYKRLVSRLS